MVSSIPVILSVGAAVLATQAAAQEPKDFYSYYDDLPFYESPDSSGIGSSSFYTETISARIECASRAVASTFSEDISAYAKAVAELTADFCDAAYDPNDPDDNRVEERLEDFASVYAEATVNADAACLGTEDGGGLAQGCSYAEGDAATYAFAMATANAEATARALATDCACTVVESWDFGDSIIVLDLYADAFADAFARACANGNQFSAASGYASCFSEILSDIYVEAVAAAKAEASDCNYGEAAAAIVAEAVIESQVLDECIFTGEAVGRADRGSEGATYPYTYDRSFFYNF